jgi:hypothetical protein
MGFLDNAKRRVGGRAEALTPDDRHTAPAERLEPKLDQGEARLTGPADPEISRMAQAFEALYSPPQAPADRQSPGWTDNHNFFADMPHEATVAAAPGEAAFLRRESPDPERTTPASRRDSAAPPESSSASPKKTTIEMVFDMRRAMDENAGTPPMQSRSAQQSHAAEPHPAAARESVRQAHSSVHLPIETQSVAAAASALVDRKEPDVPSSGWSPRAREPLHEPAEWSARQRRIHVRMLAGAALALIVGTGVGYVVGKGEPAGSRASVEWSDRGMKLQLDRDLRQQ